MVNNSAASWQGLHDFENFNPQSQNKPDMVKSSTQSALQYKISHYNHTEIVDEGIENAEAGGDHKQRTLAHVEELSILRELADEEIQERSTSVPGDDDEEDADTLADEENECLLSSEPDSEDNSCTETLLPAESNDQEATLDETERSDWDFVVYADE